MEQYSVKTPVVIYFLSKLSFSFDYNYYSSYCVLLLSIMYPFKEKENRFDKNSNFRFVREWDMPARLTCLYHRHVRCSRIIFLYTFKEMLYPVKQICSLTKHPLRHQPINKHSLLTFGSNYRMKCATWA